MSSYIFGPPNAVTAAAYPPCAGAETDSAPQAAASRAPQFSATIEFRQHALLALLPGTWTTHRNSNARGARHAHDLAQDVLDLHRAPRKHVAEHTRHVRAVRARVQPRSVSERARWEVRVKRLHLPRRGEERGAERGELRERVVEEGRRVRREEGRSSRDGGRRSFAGCVRRARGLGGRRGGRAGLEVRGAEELAEGEAGERGGGAEHGVPHVLAELDALDLGHNRGLGAACGEEGLELGEERGLGGSVARDGGRGAVYAHRYTILEGAVALIANRYEMGGAHEFVMLDDVLVEQASADPDGGADDAWLLVRTELLERVVEIDLNIETVLEEHVGRLGVGVRVGRREQGAQELGGTFELWDGFRG